MIRETLALINHRIAVQILSVDVQTNGIATPFYDQQEGATTLKLDDGSRLTIDSRYLWQSAHLTKGAKPSSQQTWGSYTDEIYEPAYTLIGLSKSANGLNIAMRALDGVAHLVNDGYNDKTLEVLSRYWYVKVGPDKNYDPDLYAFAIDYHLTGVDELDFAQIPTFGEVAQLPVEVPEPIVGPPGPPGPPGPSANLALLVVGETPTGSLNGANTTFVTQFNFVPETVQVHLNGLRQTLITDYRTSGQSMIILTNAPFPNESLLINYTKA